MLRPFLDILLGKGRLIFFEIDQYSLLYYISQTIGDTYKKCISSSYVSNVCNQLLKWISLHKTGGLRHLKIQPNHVYHIALALRLIVVVVRVNIAFFFITSYYNVLVYIVPINYSICNLYLFS